jgi:ketosteroid isomerase-like protein
MSIRLPSSTNLQQSVPSAQVESSVVGEAGQVSVTQQVESLGQDLTSQFEAGTAQTGNDQVAAFAQSANAVPTQGQSLFALQMSEVAAPQAAFETPVANTTQQAQAVAQVAPVELTEAQRNEQVIREFYTALQEKDYDKLVSLYHPDATFSDPAYPDLKGDKLRSMWKLITSADPLDVSFRDVKANPDGTVSGHWDANYELLKGNPIFNQIDSKFVMKDGKILSHTDSFDFAKWADQAFPGILGKAIGTRVGQFLMQKVFLPFSL